MPKSKTKRKRPLAEKEISNRPKKYRKWNEELMLGAMRAVTEGMGINRAAVEFGLPKSTLKDRISGRVEHGTNPGRVPYLSASEEQELVNYIFTCADIGYPKRRHDVLSIVCKTLEEKNGGPVKFNGKGWWLRFMQRWPKLTLRRGDPLAQPRLSYPPPTPNITNTPHCTDSAISPAISSIVNTPGSALYPAISPPTPIIDTPHRIGSAALSPPTPSIIDTPHHIGSAALSPPTPSIIDTPHHIGSAALSPPTPSIIDTPQRTDSAVSSAISPPTPSIIDTPQHTDSAVSSAISPPTLSIIDTPHRTISTPSGKRKVLSPITQFLSYPNVTSNKAKSNSSAVNASARVLTSSDAIALMEMKAKKKEDELLAKEMRKKEREEKKCLREIEAKRKAEEKEKKAATKKKVVMEKEALKKKKAELRLRNKKKKSNKENDGDGSGTSHAGTGCAGHGTSNSTEQNECSVCLGSYEDDFIDGVLQKEWIRCTNETCGLWMHCDCLSTDGNSYVCYICNLTFK